MNLRIVAVCVLSSLACEDGSAEWGKQGTPYASSGTNGDAPRTDDPVPPEPPLCPPGFGAGICFSEFTVVLEASEPWPLGRYFLRVALDRGPPRVCEVAFEAVVGAVTDTCNDPTSGFRVTYRYDAETRAIEKVTFDLAQRVDMEILTAESSPPLVEVHHDPRVLKCSFVCDYVAPVPLVAKVDLDGAALPGVDAGHADTGRDASD